MIVAIDTNSPQYRLQCEARNWLRQGYDTPEKVAELMARIEKKRGIDAAVELREEMRNQWKCRDQWQGESA